MRVVVIGGTGLIGSKLVAILREQGHEMVSAAPETGVNTLTGEGLAEALEGADVAVDASNAPSFEEAAATEFFETSTRNILAAEAAAGVGHHVALSVAGAHHLYGRGYFRAKIEQERLIEQSRTPYSIVYTTQFFEFIDRIADAATDGNTVRLPPVLCQPMAADDAASAVARIAAGPPTNRVLEFGGPQQFRLDALVRHALRARHDLREVVTDPDARYFGLVVEERTLLPDGRAILGGTRLEDWLARPARRTPSAQPQPQPAGGAA